MQSILQYKRFRAVAQRQIDSKRPARDLERGVSTSAARASSSSERTVQGNDEKPKEEVESAEPPAEEANDGEENNDKEDRSHLSRATSEQSVGVALGHSLTGVKVRRRTTNEPGNGNVFVVSWQGDDDPENPHNWSLFKRVAITLGVASIGFVVGFASSIDSSALKPAAEAFGVGEVVESMATGLFLIGFGCGALMAGPLSEAFGRNPVYLGTLVLYMIFIMASALAPNIGAQLVFRFLAGFFGSTPLVCAGGSLSDIWNARERTIWFVLFAVSGFVGPISGPVAGGWIVEYLDWRWVDWVTLIISGFVTLIVFFFQPETFAPVLLQWKAKQMRAITGDDRYKSDAEVKEEDFGAIVYHTLARPFVMTAQEPIIMIFALYMTVIYIVLFTFLDGFNYIFGQTYGLSDGLVGTCFLGIDVGVVLAVVLVPLIYHWQEKGIKERQEKEGKDYLAPEFRLWYSMLGGAFAIPISLFWMGWTAYPSISIASPLLASVLFGYGILCVFITVYQYIIDSYEAYAASALASITMIRYVASGAMTIVGIPFYKNLGVHYTLTILACISAVMVPAPYILYIYGSRIRSKSKFAVNQD